MTNDRFLSQVCKMRGLILDIALLNENLLQLKGDIAIQSAARMEAKAHQILGEIQQVLSAPQGESQHGWDEWEEQVTADHIILIHGDTVKIKQSRSIPTGDYTLTEDDRENLVEAIAAATEPLPFTEETKPSDDLDIFVSVEAERNYSDGMAVPYGSEW